MKRLRWLSAGLLVVAFCSTLPAQEHSFKIRQVGVPAPKAAPLDIRGNVGVPIYLTVGDAKIPLTWLVLDDGLSMIPASKLANPAEAIFIAIAKGQYRVIVYAKSDRVPPAVALITIGDGPPPVPIPPDPTPPTPAPPIPTNLKAAVNGTTATLSWSASEGALSYQLDRSTNAGAFGLLANVAGTSVLDADLKAGASYAYRVRAVNANGQSENSASISFAIPDVPPPDPAPIPVAGFRVLILFETMDVGKMPEAQRAFITSVPLRQYLDSKCTKGADGKTADYRYYDPSEAASTANAPKVFKDAMARKRGSLPWIIVSNGVTGVEQALPASVPEIIALCQKYEPK